MTQREQPRYADLASRGEEAPVMAEPGDHRAAAAGGRGRLRASDEDREQVIEVLKDAFVQGRLTQDELDTGVGQALASRTYAELVTVTADIPGGPAVTPSPRQPARAQNRAPGSHTARDVAIGLGLGLGLVAAIVPGGLLQYAPLLLIPAAFILLVLVPCVVLCKMA
jgi:Flp pilus assembly protein TadB